MKLDFSLACNPTDVVPSKTLGERCRMFDQPLRKTAQILDFDLSRARPGLRTLIGSARALLDKSEDGGEWVAGDITPDLIRNFFKTPDDLLLVEYDEMSQLAEHGSLLALQAIHDGTWARQRELGFFMNLQARAVEQKPANKHVNNRYLIN